MTICAVGREVGLRSELLDALVAEISHEDEALVVHRHATGENVRRLAAPEIEIPRTRSLAQPQRPLTRPLGSTNEQERDYPVDGNYVLLRKA